MKSFHEYMTEYRKLLEKGDIQEAYRGLMDFFQGLRIYFQKQYPEHFVSGSIYSGYMDMTYFSFSPQTLRNRKLKIAIVFVHETFRFEVWLAGANRTIQTKYWKLITENKWNKYRVVSPAKGIDSIIEHVLIDNPDFGDLDALTLQIERGTLKFIQDVETFLAIGSN